MQIAEQRNSVYVDDDIYNTIDYDNLQVIRSMKIYNAIDYDHLQVIQPTIDSMQRNTHPPTV